MCSSPKSSMTARAPKQIIRGVLEEMSPEQRKRFAQTANRADERRRQRLETQSRWQAKHKNKAKQRNTGNWFSNLFRI
ncbi:hypothetical protein [Lacimicrobium alkaliphilum]|uniref:BZIP domain-containing protein n=1 Tax=Lacimicrobium alkaliphilum TaxID=1526571 RepID=A0ABQ1RD62_9ALTE|nr:hypothetical protein [Lacimicrobium alkaliphilum]GGD66547.1 hypothetical protein GCM10011357_22270 [Lacimicrobium alkaliphilum]